MSKLIRGIAVTIGALALTVAGAWPANGTTTHTSTATIKSSPDDGCPAWARDTYVRTTTITHVEGNKFAVSIADAGTFTTVKGANSPTGQGKVEGVVTGQLVGSGQYTVTGELRNTTGLKALSGKVFNNAPFACKKDVPADRGAAKWPLQFFKPGAETIGINPWTWKYTTPCELRVESSVAADNSGNIVGKTCPGVVSLTPATCTNAKAAVKVFNPNSHATLNVRFNAGPTFHVRPGQTEIHVFSAGTVQVKVNGGNVGAPFSYTSPTGCATPTASASASPTGRPTPTASASAKPTPTVPTVSATASPTKTVAPPVPAANSGNSGGGLPVTGTAVAGIALAGVVVAAAGTAAVVAARRRRTRFTA